MSWLRWHFIWVTAAVIDRFDCTSHLRGQRLVVHYLSWLARHIFPNIWLIVWVKLTNLFSFSIPKAISGHVGTCATLWMHNHSNSDCINPIFFLIYPQKLTGDHNFSRRVGHAAQILSYLLYSLWIQVPGKARLPHPALELGLVDGQC